MTYDIETLIIDDLVDQIYMSVTNLF